MDTDVNFDRLRAELGELHKRRNDIERLIKRKNLLMLKALPGVHGFESMDAFIGALAQFASKELKDRIGAVPQSLKEGSRKRRRCSAESRVGVRKTLEAGESIAEIAPANGMAAATVTRWKNLWGVDAGRRSVRTTGLKPVERAPHGEGTVSTLETSGSSEDWAL